MMVGRGKPGHLWTCTTCHMEKDKFHHLSFANYLLNCLTTICCGKSSENYGTLGRGWAKKSMQVANMCSKFT